MQGVLGSASARLSSARFHFQYYGEARVGPGCAIWHGSNRGERSRAQQAGRRIARRTQRSALAAVLLLPTVSIAPVAALCHSPHQRC